MLGGVSGGGTGSSLTKATVIVCGVASLVASLLSFLYELLSSHEALSSPCAHSWRSANISFPDQFGFRRSYAAFDRLPRSANRERSKNYRKPLLQRYVVRILLMYAENASFRLILIKLQGSYIFGVLLGQHNVSGRSLLSRSFARHL